ncbi:MAG: hypothetical protein MI717_02420 [Spirochaetales bacterium]|nr:hypothetical protein [Spirochaetales bacterium]
MKKTPFFSVVFWMLFLIGCSSRPMGEQPVGQRTSQADALMESGYNASGNFESTLALASFEDALGLYALDDHREGMVVALLAMEREARILGDVKSAGIYLHHAQALALATSSPRLRRIALNAVAAEALRIEDFDKAREALGMGEEGQNALVSQGRERAVQLRLLGRLADVEGRKTEAQVFLQEAVEVAREAMAHGEAAQACYKLASMASLVGDYDEAKTWALEALKEDGLAGNGAGVAADLRALGIISEKSGDGENAADYYRRSWLAWRALGRFGEAAAAQEALESLLGESVGFPGNLSP